jgi:hypothetical protein
MVSHLHLNVIRGQGFEALCHYSHGSWLDYVGSSKGYLAYILHLGVVASYLGDLLLSQVQAKGQNV